MLPPSIVAIAATVKGSIDEARVGLTNMGSTPLRATATARSRYEGLVVLPERTPLANVHMTMLDKLGIPQPSFGNSTGLLPGV